MMPHTIIIARRPGRRGAVSVVVLVFLAMFAALGAAYATATNANLRQADNAHRVQDALLQAESGLEYCNRLMNDASIPPGAAGEDLLLAIESHLRLQLDYTENLDGRRLPDVENGVIEIPDVATDDAGGSFSAEIRVDPDDDQRLSMTITGRQGEIRRRVRLDYGLEAGSHWIWDYGVVSGGPIRLTGNARIQGANSRDEAKMLSATRSTDEAFKLTGNVRCDGDIYAGNPDAYASLTGNVSVGGVSCRDDDIEDHIHIGVDHGPLPRPDPNEFKHLATNVVDSRTRIRGNRSFENIVIKAGTNPTFSGNLDFQGIIYIEQPNRVHFSGNVDITGYIVSDDPGEDEYDDNTIKFSGNTDINPVTELPNDPKFDEVRQNQGVFLMTPGFSAEFVGNFGTVSGCIIAEKLKWTGNAGGVVRGPVISYADEEMKLVGNSQITIDWPDRGDAPPGFSAPWRIGAVRGSYREVTGGQ
jgi:hypothetical protein